MAEKNVSVVKDLLTKAVKAVEGLANAPEGEHSTTNQSPATSKQSTSASFKTEMQRLFPNVYGKKRSSSNNTKFSNKKRSTKKEKTVTRKFVCLADKSQEEVPSVQDKRKLFLCGLGEKKIALPVNGTSAQLHSVLLESFPKLSDGGGIELMYAEPGKRELYIIPTGPHGNTVEYISQFIGQGRICVRPIQCDIDLDKGQVYTDPTVMDEMCNSCLKFFPMDRLREHLENCRKKTHLQCKICLQQVVGNVASLACCNDVFHEDCLEEWHNTSDGTASKCPVCKQLFFTIEPREVNDLYTPNQISISQGATLTQSETITTPLQREDKATLPALPVPSLERQQNKTSGQLPRQQTEINRQPFASSLNLMPLEETGNTDLFYGSLFDDDPISIELDSDDDQLLNEAPVVAVTDKTPTLSLQEILSELAQSVNDTKISKFNICRNDIWEGTKRGLTRKSFSPTNKISVRFSDDSGKSEGAVDMGGPTREFLTLVVEWLANSHLFCGPKETMFLSCNAACLANSEYLYAGKLTALSLVHGGPGLSFFSPVLYDALIKGPDKVKANLEDVYDPELKLSLWELSGAKSVQEAYDIVSRKNLDTILELGGTLQQIKSIKDIDNIVQRTAHWYTLGRAWAALEQFKQGLSDLGVLTAVLHNPDVFTPVFCYFPVELDADSFNAMFTILFSEEGSNKRSVENVTLSYWQDYLQDVEEGETTVTFRELLFFTCGCKECPPLQLGWNLSLGFLHDPDKLSPYPLANTCGPLLQLPVVHKSYNSFRDAITFAIGNSKGFGYA